jgi:hypothetical protein
VRAPLVEAEQDRSIRIQDLTEVVMARRRLGLAKERLVRVGFSRGGPSSHRLPPAANDGMDSSCRAASLCQR